MFHTAPSSAETENKETKDEKTDISTYAVVQPGIDISSVSNCFVLTGFSPDGE